MNIVTADFFFTIFSVITNDIINLFLVKQEYSSGASFEKSRSIEPYANSSPNRFFP